MSRSRRRPPPREPNEEERSIIVAVRHCARELDDMLQGARRKAQVDAKLFAEKTAPSLFRGLEFYIDMYSKLKIKSRIALTRLFQRSSDLDDMVDAQEAIEETEECWRCFLSNLDNDIRNAAPQTSPNSVKGIGDYIELSKPRLINCSSFEECNLQRILSRFTSTLLIFQPAYLPDTAARCRSSEISKVAADFYQLNVGFVVLTWGPESVVRDWSKHLLKHLKWPVLWDCDSYFPSFLSFKRGCASLWAPEMLDFCAYQNTAYKRSVQPPPIDIDWGLWNWVGGEVMIASPAVSRMLYKRDLDTLSQKNLDDEKSVLPPLPNLPDTGSSSRICFIHRADNVADMAPPGSIYQAALTCYAISQNKNESEVVEEIRTHRRLATPPESGRLQYEEATGLYYDPETELHYDSRTGYFYDAVRRTYYYWSAESHRYILANDLVRAQQAKAHKLRLEAAQQAAFRAVREQEAARAAGARVAAQLAALRAEKDEYASYAYATCLLDPADDPIASLHSTSSANIQESLRLLGGGVTTPSTLDATIGPSPTSHEHSLYPPGCPPPPGV